MPSKDPRIDAYIARAAEFARPILRHLRSVVHAACLEVEETLKWGMPSFEYHGLLCGMAAFKAHATFGFWKGKFIVDARGRDVESAMGQFGRITSVADLPARRVLAGYVKQAMALNFAGVQVAKPATARKPIAVPPAFKAALARNAKARATFEAFAPSACRDYLEWVSEAKQEATRAHRIATAIKWLAQGKRRNWKYEKC